MKKKEWVVELYVTHDFELITQHKSASKAVIPDESFMISISNSRTQINWI